MFVYVNVFIMCIVCVDMWVEIGTGDISRRVVCVVIRMGYVVCKGGSGGGDIQFAHILCSHLVFIS